jgi:hypothetical protein
LEEALQVMLEALQNGGRADPGESDAIDHVRAAIDSLRADDDIDEAIDPEDAAQGR